MDRLVELNKGDYPSLATNPGVIEVGWTLQLPGKALAIPINTPSIGSGTPVTVSLDRDAFEAEIIRLVNEERAKAGLAPLAVDPEMMQFARERSEDMVDRGYLSHYDPVTGEDLSGPAGENLLDFPMRFGVPVNMESRSVSGWMASEGHRANILNAGAIKTGVGVAVANNRIVVTQLFRSK